MIERLICDMTPSTPNTARVARWTLVADGYHQSSKAGVFMVAAEATGLGHG